MAPGNHIQGRWKGSGHQVHQFGVLPSHTGDATVYVDSVVVETTLCPRDIKPMQLLPGEAEPEWITGPTRENSPCILDVEVDQGT